MLANLLFELYHIVYAVLSKRHCISSGVIWIAFTSEELISNKRNIYNRS